MDAELLGKLTRVEGDLVSAMLTGDGELAAYDFAWTSLLDQISQASAFGDISTTTLAVVDDVVARVSTLAECCLSLSSVPNLSSRILRVNLNASSSPPFHTATSFIPEAYSWLLGNIANPYPSSEFKLSLAQRYDSPVSAVNSWFVNVRRRMGWTTLCRDFFRNCRADAVDAAYRVLMKGDPNHQLGSEITHAFVAMKVTAEGLYTASAKSALAGDLDTVVKDMLAEDKILESDGRHGLHRETGKIVCLKEREENTQKQATHTLDISQKNSTTPTCYPSPNFSHSSSLVPGLDDSFTDESEDEGDIFTPVLAGRKRRLSPLEPAQVAISSATTRSVKRPRFSSSLTNACLLSMLTGTEGPLENDSYDQMSHSAPGTQNSANINFRKRRPSDPHTTAMPEPPQASMAGSDSPLLSTLESEYSIDEWFNTNFDALFAFPPPVDVAEPDASTQWEVGLFNNYSIPEDLQKALTPPIQDTQISPADLNVLEDFLQCLESSEFIASPETIRPLTIASVPAPVSQGLPLLPDLSQSIDWTAFLNEVLYEPTNDPIFPPFYVNSALPEFDISVLQLPQVWTAVAS